MICFSLIRSVTIAITIAIAIAIAIAIGIYLSVDLLEYGELLCCCCLVVSDLSTVLVLYTYTMVRVYIQL